MTISINFRALKIHLTLTICAPCHLTDLVTDTEILERVSYTQLIP